MELDMTKGRPMPMMLRFFLPVFLGNMFQQVYNLVDTIIVGHFVGQGAFAAVGSTGTIMFLILGFANGLATGFTVLTSQRFGAKDMAGVKASVANGILLTVIVSIFTTVVGGLAMKTLLHLMNTPSDIYQDAYTYIITIVYGVTCCAFYNLFSSLLRAVGNSKVPLYFLIFSAFLNIAMDLILIAGLGIGVLGAALATVFSQGVSAVLCGAYIYFKVPILRPDRGDWYFHRNATVQQVRVGLPMALQFAITASGTMIMQSAINMFGTVAITGFTAAGKVSNILTQAFPSLGQTMATYCGQNFGKLDTGRIKSGVKVATVLGLLFSIVGAILAAVLLKPAIPLFLGADADVEALLPWARQYMILSATFYFPLAVLFICRDAMQGCGYGFLPLMGGVLELVARVVMAGLSIHFESFLLGVAGDPAAWVATGVYGVFAYLYVMHDVEKRYHLGKFAKNEEG